jgi:16S rRNA (cytosine967-C5)-methyltransferase
MATLGRSAHHVVYRASKQGHHRLMAVMKKVLAVLVASCCLCISFVHAFSLCSGVHRYHDHAQRNLRLLFQSSSSTTPSSPLTNEKSQQGDDTDGLSSSSSSYSSTSPCNARFLAAKALLKNNNKNGSGSPSAEFAVERLEADYDFNHQLSLRDKGFARLIVSTVERRMGQIDVILNHCSIDTKRNRNNKNSGEPSNNNKKPKRPSAKPSRVDEYVQAVLRVGAAQLLFLDTSPHAAVKETVDLLRIQQTDDTQDPTTSITGGSWSADAMVVNKNIVEVPKSRIGYVNAVLRRISREGPELLAMTSVLDNVAPWLLKELNDSWSKEATLGIVQADMRESPRCLSIRRQWSHNGIGDQRDNGIRSSAFDDENQAQWQQSIQNVAALFPNDCQVLPQGSIRIHTLPSSGSIANWPLYTTGAWWLQDVSSTLPAIALYRTLQSQNQNGSVADLTVIDLCAAPGGKTAQLCNYGFGHVIAVEKSSRRSKRLEKNLERLRFRGNTTSTSPASASVIDNESDSSTPLRQQRHHYSLVVADGTKYVPETRVAGVLLDAPCTATGTASKRPDVLRRNADFTDLLDTQYRLACHAADHMLKVGGILVYATCSLLKREGEDQIQRLLARTCNNDAQDSTATATAVLETIPFVPGEIPGFDAAINANGWLRVLPTCSGKDEKYKDESMGSPSSNSGLFDLVDGFFVARLRRVR